MLDAGSRARNTLLTAVTLIMVHNFVLPKQSIAQE
jgi:hypothetical protein